jgi:hypothetical protein
MVDAVLAGYRGAEEDGGAAAVSWRTKAPVMDAGKCSANFQRNREVEGFVELKTVPRVDGPEARWVDQGFGDVEIIASQPATSAIPGF